MDFTLKSISNPNKYQGAIGKYWRSYGPETRLPYYKYLADVASIKTLRNFFEEMVKKAKSNPDIALTSEMSEDLPPTERSLT